ncbi:MAG: hypothetical protein AAFR24_15575 [Cyanobacteria bacterium J06627_3]
MQEIQIAAGCKTRIIRRQFSSLVTTYTFDVAPVIQNNHLAGTVEIKGSNWIFPKPVQRMPLQPSNVVTAGFWDTFFSVYVFPEVDVVISLPSKSFGGPLWVIGFIVIMVAVAVVFFLLT